MISEDRWEYLKEKRLEVLEKIKPICEAFGLDDYDYEISETACHEVLRLGETRIGCSSNSISAIVDELIGFLFIKLWCRHRGLGAFATQSKNVIKQYWIKEVKTSDK